MENREGYEFGKLILLYSNKWWKLDLILVNYNVYLKPGTFFEYSWIETNEIITVLDNQVSITY